jgi:hypothetical protein
MVGVHVYGFDLGAQTAAPVKVTEHDELADPHHLVAQLGHEHGASAIFNLVQGRSVEGDVATLWRDLAWNGTAVEQLNDPGQVVVRCPANQHS